jgi:hypothetical protein
VLGVKSHPVRRSALGIAMIVVVLGTMASAQESTPGLAGTTWRGTTSNGSAHEISFLDGGQIRFTTLGQKDETRGTWEQRGPVVSFEVNRYSRWSGTLGGDTMEGSARNSTGATWTWKLVRRTP